jgi:hypothetical protein
MTFKQWINQLSTAHLMALAYHVGFSTWRAADKRQLCSFLMSSKPAKQMFIREKLAEIKTGGVDHKA